MKYITSIKDQEFAIEILDENRISVDGKEYDINFESINGQPVYTLLINGKSYDAYVYESEDGWEVLLRGSLYQSRVIDEREQRLRTAFADGLAQTGEFQLKAPMPGLVIDVVVTEGQEVAEGDVLMILESMKMQNELKAPQAGVVSRVRVAVGEYVERRQTLLSVG